MVLVGTSAYTAPTFAMAEGTMTVVADRWFPRPNVTWMDHERKVLQSTTSMTENSAGIFSLVSSLPQVNTSETYTVSIYNQLVQSVSRARIAGTLGGDGGLGGRSGVGGSRNGHGFNSSLPGSNISASSYFIFSRAPRALTPFHPSLIAAVACIYVLM